MTNKMTFKVNASRVDAHGSTLSCKDAGLVIDTDLQGRKDAFNPAELLMGALAACIIKGIERVTPILKFDLQGLEVEIHGVRQDAPPKMESMEYSIKVKTSESDQRLALLHDNVRKFGTVYNTIAPGTELTGTLTRAD
ncbi:OsmC family protein [Marinomonas sp. A79]|uniref:OsmC family protein n=1 Tax=Marinomonas vulgaris TaxID=2823372 RepID=A0ABS5H6S4_9GAMM|nr:OsmC family protein [Marinomonas vulgaris]MBR7887412.1 OsmC family protein [Marinomonas vulgaris]